MSLEVNVYQFSLGLDCVSGEMVFGLRKGDEIPILSCMGFALTFNSCKYAI